MAVDRNRKTHASFIIACFLVYAGTRDAHAGVELDVYPYLDGPQSDADLTITAATRITDRLSYFSFLNFGGFFHSGPFGFQTSDQNLRWKISERSPIDLAIQAVIRNGSDNNTFHAGIRWRLGATPGIQSLFEAIHLDYSVQFFPMRIDERYARGWQISHSYRLTFPYISDRLYFSGFLDHNIDERIPSGGRRDNVISENQLGLRLFGGVYAVAEYRFNEYRVEDQHNLAIGLEFKFDR